MSEQNIPKHVAIIMDGNGRWAKKKLLPRAAGHVAGVNAVQKAVEFAAENNISVLTLFALSIENYGGRPKEELSHLMSLIVKQLAKHVTALHEKNVKISFIGDHGNLSVNVRQEMDSAVSITADNTGLQLVFAINYSGLWDITNAAQRVAEKVSEGCLALADITQEEMNKHISLSELPKLDLMIRTSGEMRLSNFLMWQSAYAELYFTETLWPDFDKYSFEQAITAFQQRCRKFGKTVEQIEADNA